MKRFLTIALVLVALAGCGGTIRRTAVAAPGGATDVASERDRAWLGAVHQASLMDVQAGRLAAQRGGSAAVRHAGSMLAAGHHELDKKVTHVANSLGIELPATESAEQLALVRRLAKKSGGTFDAEFVSAMTESHEQLIADTEAEIRSGSAPAVRSLARAALPDLREHLAMLRKASPVG
jgi:putative membrane protein